ncbi:MAG: 1-deoxy-D-xylulose-5-phosphate reductoisomerase [Candidatus Omnitrophica bacterium]|nr:1-deoxy-D-xylulose-5-phosphate reductoisomerase [Candidatus Omnitrophota bacterium]
MKRIAILGSTGSIGISALEVIKKAKNDFKAVALSANSNIALLKTQINRFNPKFVCINDGLFFRRLLPEIKNRVRAFSGSQGLLSMLRHKDIDTVLLAISGSAALEPLLEAISCKKTICLANKEALVMAGAIIMKRAALNKVKIIPIDSEQSAIWQCLQGEDRNKIKRIYLTASGGPFRKINGSRLKKVSVRDCLAHPRWKMGRKITIDSASLMNKGLELIEAMHLFGVGPDKIKVIVHPEAVIHSMVEFVDGVILAQLSVTDMRIPIKYALSYPERIDSGIKPVDFVKLKKLNFEAPDLKKFPCLGLAYQAAEKGGTFPCVINAANEVSVQSFLRGKIRFIDIPAVIEKVMSKHKFTISPSLGDIQNADNWARNESYAAIERLN